MYAVATSAVRRMVSKGLMLSAIAGALVFTSSSVCSAAEDVTVQGKQGPWVWQNGGLNASFDYNAGIDDQQAPTVISTSSSVSISPGVIVTVTYVSGLVSIGGGFPNVDAGGNTAIPENNKNLGGVGVWPSFYMPAATYPIYSSELVGTFADSTGAIVGTPFAVGDSASLTVPAGASQLQLGVNDTGSLSRNISSL